jgi:hypothetical protein
MQIKLCYFNQHWNVYLYTEEGYEGWIRKMHQAVIPNEEGEYRLRKYDCSEAPIFSFGYMYNEENAHKRPGHGGEWSSNSMTINKVFGTNLIEVAIDQMSVAVPLDWLKKLLGKKVIWGKSHGWPDITHIKGIANEYEKWVEF